MDYKIIKITDDLFEESIEVLYNAIQDDPNKVYYFPDKIEREKNTKWIIRKMMTTLKPLDNIYAIIENSKILGVACWVPPSKKVSFFVLIKSGLLMLPFKFGFKVFKKVVSSFSISESNIHKFVKADNYWQLFYLGIARGHQGRGLGTALMKPIITKAKEDNHTIILENFTVENTKFYESNGFSVVTQTELEKDILLRLMVRSPEGK